MRKPDIDGGAIETLLRHVFGTAVSVVYERTDAELLCRLRRDGVKVSDVVHAEAFNAAIGKQCSRMGTSTSRRSSARTGATPD